MLPGWPWDTDVIRLREHKAESCPCTLQSWQVSSQEGTGRNVQCLCRATDTYVAPCVLTWCHMCQRSATSA
eukprot:scaffold102105_cov20-Tisochrysis_lutea.AAC.1